MAQKNFDLWLDLVKIIANKSPKVPNLLCPRCGMQMIDFQYVGDPTNRIGYLDIWCKSCLHGVHISRTGIPDNADILSFEASDQEFIDRIPNFIQVSPID